ncbi:hypothetical protein BgramDRAFT_2666 [Paraburkholderia graminis C4D1M]|jgi:hypothetical protein|uniref:Uncharacterized protein n=1 Tax=Paraburkholderia graminis (strain ATCC 700544 / DSM 17151 / LMG 18924 / NCIMB 13744 / C4D1M) TaxID=396598 RepID=B1FZS9_PARG4|nr:hypothetical protein BgramDRAFT_2666 [Paraburkholderia graminis C4D1M]
MSNQKNRKGTTYAFATIGARSAADALLVVRRFASTAFR